MSNDFAVSYNNWKTNLTGAPVDASDTELMTLVHNMDNAISNSDGNGIWDTMNQDPTQPWLWEDAKTWATNSADITSMMKRVRQMAVQGETTASALYNNLELQAAIAYAVNWIITHCYNTSVQKEYTNWWDWEIGTPAALNDTLYLAKDYLPAQLLNDCLLTINFFVPDPKKKKSNGITETGANLLDKCFVVALAAVLNEDSARVTLGLESAGSAYEYILQGDGYYRDGSFIQHTNVPYTGGYGEVLLSRTCDIFILFKDTASLALLNNVDNVYDFIVETYAPTIYSDINFDMTRGRGISRETAPAHSIARSLLYSIYFISGTHQDQSYRTDWSIFVKSAIASDKFYSNYYLGLSITKTQSLRELINNQDVPVNADSRNQNIMMSAMCQMIHQKGAFAFGLSMFSNKITAFECGNEENKHGWYTGTGMLYLYNANSTQFDEDYWPTVNMLRLPGTTTDSREGVLTEWHLYPNEAPQNWSGGVSTGVVGHASLVYTLKGVTGSSLAATKSWFMLDDHLVALVAGVSSTDSNPVETIVENRQLAAGTNQIFQVNGAQINASVSEHFSNATWAHLSDDVNQAPIGYVFLDPASLLAENVSREGSWSTLNVKGSTTVLAKPYATLSIQHDVMPDNAATAYAILPNYSLQQTQSYQQSPPIRVVNNDTVCQAIATTDNLFWGGNFYQPGHQENIQAITTGSILISRSQDRITLAFSDPTRSLSMLQFVITNFTASRVIQQPAEIDVTHDAASQTLTVTVHTSALTGDTSTLVMS